MMFRKSLVLASTVALAGLVPFSANAETPSDQLVMARNIDAISTFDPAQIGEVVTDELIVNICDTLVTHDVAEESKVVPSLAESWEISDDNKVITFTLRDGLAHPSGNPVTAHDMEWSMKRVLELEFGNAASLTQWGFTKENMDDAFQALDDKTFQVTLQDPYPPGLIMLAVMTGRVAMALDSEFLKPQEVDGDRANGYLTTNTACVGPYHLRQWDAGEVAVLEVNSDYWGGQPAMRRIIVRHVPEASAQRLLIEKGDIDVARDISTPNDLAELETSDDIIIDSKLRHQLTYWGFNNADPILGNDTVREAMRYLIDYDGLHRTVMKYTGVPRNTMIPIGAFGALDEDEGAPYSLDLDKARTLLDEAGHGDGFPIRLFIGSAPLSPALAQHIQENAAKVGIEISIEQMANAELFSRFRGRDFDTVMLAWSTGLPDAHGMAARHAVNPDNSDEARLTMYPTWRASWFREEFNALIDEAVFETDPDRRLELYREIQLRHMKEGPFAYMFQQRQNIVLRNEVTAYPWHALRQFYHLIEKE